MCPEPFRRALIVANPIAGRGRARPAVEALERELRERGLEVETFETSARGDAERKVAALDPGVDLVLSVGGDGTLAEILTTLPESIPVAVLPLGTANVLGMELGLPQDAEGLAEIVARGNTCRLNTAKVNGRLSFLATGVGFDGEIVQDLEARRRGPITKLFYVRSVLRTLLRNRRPKLSVWIDGQPLPGTWAWVVVSNVNGYAGLLHLSPDGRLDDGHFEVYLFPHGGRWALIGYGLRGLVRHLPGGSCKMVPARAVRIEAESPTPVQVDGDFAGHTPVNFEVQPHSHRLVIP